METEKISEAGNASEPLELWAIVELMGRQTVAGKVTEVQIAGKGMLRVDVPAVGAIPAFTKFYSPTAVYAITPVSEEIAMEAASQVRTQPVKVYVVPDPSRQLEDRGYNGEW